jgi:hypothetical protein
VLRVRPVQVLIAVLDQHFADRDPIENPLDYGIGGCHDRRLGVVVIRPVRCWASHPFGPGAFHCDFAAARVDSDLSSRETTNGHEGSERRHLVIAIGNIVSAR